MTRRFVSLLSLFFCIIPLSLAVEWDTIITPQDLQTISPSEFVGLSPSQLSRIPASACSGFSGPQLRNIQSTIWSSFTGECIAQIPSTSFSFVSRDQIMKLSDQIFQFLTSQQCALMDVDTLSGLQQRQLSSMNKGCISGLSAEQLVGLAKLKKDFPSLWNTDQWSMVNHTVMYNAKLSIYSGALSPSLNWNDFSVITQITWIQLALMRLETMPLQIDANIVASLPSQTHAGWRKDQVQLITTSGISKIDDKAASFILSDTLSAMNGAQLGAISPDAFGALNLEALANIDITHIPFITSKQISRLNLNISTLWNCKHLAALNRRQWRAWMRVDESFRTLYSNCKITPVNSSGNGTSDSDNNNSMPKYIAIIAIASCCILVLIGAGVYFWYSGRVAERDTAFDYQPIINSEPVTEGLLTNNNNDSNNNNNITTTTTTTSNNGNDPSSVGVTIEN